MAFLQELEQYEAGIYQLETTDPVEGGENGIDNLPNKQLANRTKWLKAQVDALLANLDADTLQGYDLNALKELIINEITNGAGEAYDTLLELQQEIESNDGDISGILSTLAQKANIGGSAAQKFKVADAEADDEAVSKGQMDNAVYPEALVAAWMSYVAETFPGGLPPIVDEMTLLPTFIADESFNIFPAMFDLLTIREEINQIRQAPDATLGSGTHTFGFGDNSGDMQELTATGDIEIDFFFKSDTGNAFIVDAKNWGAYTITHPIDMQFEAGEPPVYTANGIDRILVTQDAVDEKLTLTVIAQDIKPVAV